MSAALELPLSAPVRMAALRELWLHTGTSCNLSCAFCHEGSKPGDERLEAWTLEAVAPYLARAAALGVERFVFTGGEPLILRGIGEILLHALHLRPCLVLTNGTAPFIRRPHELARLRTTPHSLSLRVSLDHPDEREHDAQRGPDNFRRALQGMKLMHQQGFELSVARHARAGEDAVRVAARYRAMFRRAGLPEHLPVVALPDLGALGATLQVSRPAAPRVDERLLCARGRMLLARGGRLRLYACALVDDDPGFDLGSDLDTAAACSVTPRHARCLICLGKGVNYGGV